MQFIASMAKKSMKNAMMMIYYSLRSYLSFGDLSTKKNTTNKIMAKW